MTQRLMSDAEIKRRKKIQGNVSRATSTLGLAGVGVGTAAALASKKPGALKAIKRAPGMKNTTASGLKDAGLYTSLASGGIGGVGGYNFAAYTNAESRKRKPVVKNMGMDMGYYGEQGRRLTQAEIEKAWTPNASTFDSERGRKKRAKGYEAGLTAASAGGAAGAAGAGVKALKQEAKNRTPGQLKAKNLPSVKAAQQIQRAKAVKTGKVAAGLAGASAVAGLGAAGVHRGRTKTWKPYAG